MNRIKLLKLAKEVGKLLYTSASQSYQDHYAIVFDDGTHKMFVNQSCFGQFGNCVFSNYTSPETIKNSKPHPAYFIFTHKRYPGREMPYYKEFMKYALNRSPYAHMFLTKNVKTATEEGIIIDARHQPQWIIGAAILVRYRHQQPSVIRNWFKFREMMNENLALFIASWFTFRHGYVVPHDQTHGHSLFQHGYYTPATIVNYCKNTPVEIRGGLLSENNYQYGKMLTIWGASVFKYTYGGQKIVITPDDQYYQMVKDIWSPSGSKKIFSIPVKSFPDYLEKFLKDNHIEGANAV